MSEPIELTDLDGLAVVPEGLKQVQIHIESALIKSVKETHGMRADGKIIFPGFIDLHVHAREYRRANESDAASQDVWNSMTAKENFATAGAAAINGGVTLFVAMPNDPDPPDNKFLYDIKTELSLTSACPVVLAAAVTTRSEPWDDLLYKVYLDPKPSLVSFHRWQDVRSVLARYSGCRMMFHAEDPEFIAAQGAIGPRWKTRPPEAEYRAVDRVLDLTAKYALRTHICHISTRKAVELVLTYNRHSSSKVTTEATPHHLFFGLLPDGIHGVMGVPQVGEEMLGCNPPIRPEDDRRFLLESLRDGYVDCLATDHAPHTVEDKNNGAPGLPHLDTLGPFVGWLIQDCGFPINRVKEIVSSAPARLLSPAESNSLGAIRDGYTASFTILDLDSTSRIEGQEILGRGSLKTRCGWSPFSGYTLKGQVFQTIIKGKCYQFKD